MRGRGQKVLLHRQHDLKPNDGGSVRPLLRISFTAEIKLTCGQCSVEKSMKLVRRVTALLEIGVIGTQTSLTSDS